MTLETGRKLLEDAGVLILPRWDMNSALVFDIFLHNIDAKHKLSPDCVTQLYMGSLYNSNKHSMLIGSLYPPNKKPIVIDTLKAFRHIMTLNIGEINPIVTVDLGVNIAKLNKA